MNTQTSSPESSDSKMNPYKISFLIIIIAVIIAGFTLLPTDKSARLAAEVNGQSITKKDFDQKYKQTLEILKATYGNEQVLDEAQLTSIKGSVLDELIAEILVDKYATDNDISVSDEEIDEEYALVAERSGGEEQLQLQLEQFEITESRFLADLKKGLLLKKSLEHYSGPEVLLVTEEEVQSTYDSLVEEAKQNNSEEEIPPYEEAREYLLDQMENQKIQINSEIFLEELKSEAEIETYI